MCACMHVCQHHLQLDTLNFCAFLTGEVEVIGVPSQSGCCQGM